MWERVMAELIIKYKDKIKQQDTKISFKKSKKIKKREVLNVVKGS